MDRIVGLDHISEFCLIIVAYQWVLFSIVVVLIDANGSGGWEDIHNFEPDALGNAVFSLVPKWIANFPYVKGYW